MALNASQQWWIRQDGDNTNGGGFDPDHSSIIYNTISQTLTLSDRTGEGVTATAGGSTFSSGDVGKMIQDNTTNSGGLAQITSYISATVVIIRILRPFISTSVASGLWKLSSQLNYCDQSSAQVSLLDIGCTASGVTTITSVTGGFTNLMIGNVIRMSGVGFNSGYYAVSGVTDSNTAALDRSPVNIPASGGVGKLGGAFATLTPTIGIGNLGLITPTIPSPVAAGHTVNIRGSGLDDPTEINYDYKGTTTQGYYSSNPNGNSTSGRIYIIGYNGRPLMQTSGIIWYLANYYYVEHLKLKFVTNAAYTNYGIFAGSTNTNVSFKDIIVDLNSNDAVALQGQNIIDCEIRNSGGAIGTQPGIVANVYGGVCMGNIVKGCRGRGISNVGAGSFIINNIVYNTLSDGIYVQILLDYGCIVIGNTVYGCGGDGIEITTNQLITGSVVMNNNISNCTGYGINCSVNTPIENIRKNRNIWDFNNLYNNTSGPYNGTLSSPNDTYLDPQFVNPTNGNFIVGSNVKGLGFPNIFRNMSTISYVDIGAVQRQESDLGLFKGINTGGSL